MKTIKELEAEIEGMEDGYCEERITNWDKIEALKDVLKLIDDFLFLYPNSRFGLEELKARISG